MSLLWSYSHYLYLMNLTHHGRTVTAFHKKPSYQSTPSTGYHYNDKRENALNSPAWAAAPSSASCRRGEHLDLPGPRGGQSPSPADPPGSEPETKPRKLGRSQTHEPERSPHSQGSFPEIHEKKKIHVKKAILQPRIYRRFVVLNKALMEEYFSIRHKICPILLCQHISSEGMQVWDLFFSFPCASAPLL